MGSSAPRRDTAPVHAPLPAVESGRTGAGNCIHLQAGTPENNFIYGWIFNTKLCRI